MLRLVSALFNRNLIPPAIERRHRMSSMPRSFRFITLAAFIMGVLHVAVLSGSAALVEALRVCTSFATLLRGSLAAEVFAVSACRPFSATTSILLSFRRNTVLPVVCNFSLFFRAGFQQHQPLLHLEQSGSQE